MGAVVEDLAKQPSAVGVGPNAAEQPPDDTVVVVPPVTVVMVVLPALGNVGIPHEHVADTNADPPIAATDTTTNACFARRANEPLLMPSLRCSVGSRSG